MSSCYAETSSAPIAVNAHGVFRYHLRILVPSGDDMVAPVLGQITGVKMRLSAAAAGAAINAAVNDLAATEEPTDPGLFYVDVSKALHETWILPLGLGVSYWTVWSLAGQFDGITRRFLVADKIVL